MIDLSYNLSPVLKDRLRKADALRKEIILAPISPKTELQIRWACLINRVFYSLYLADNPLTKPEVINILTSYGTLEKSGKKISNSDQKDVINYKKALDHISQNWLVTQKNVTVKDVLILYDIFCDGSNIIPLARIEELLNYVQAHEEHPVIQAGIINIELLKIEPFSTGNGRLSRLLSYLFFYKYGYDVRGLIQFEKSWSQDRGTYLDAVKIGLEASSITIWLEFFSNSLILQLESVFKKVKSASPDNLGMDSSFWDLNDRQKSILSILGQPGISTTNKKVQEQFKVSQITASRDLSKLASLGLLFSHGKGRSVYYTKV